MKQWACPLPVLGLDETQSDLVNSAAFAAHGSPSLLREMLNLAAIS